MILFHFLFYLFPRLWARHLDQTGSGEMQLSVQWTVGILNAFLVMVRLVIPLSRFAFYIFFSSLVLLVLMFAIVSGNCTLLACLVVHRTVDCKLSQFWILQM